MPFTSPCATQLRTMRLSTSDYSLPVHTVVARSRRTTFLCLNDDKGGGRRSWHRVCAP